MDSFEVSFTSDTSDEESDSSNGSIVEKDITSSSDDKAGAYVTTESEVKEIVTQSESKAEVEVKTSGVDNEDVAPNVNQGGLDDVKATQDQEKGIDVTLRIDQNEGVQDDVTSASQSKTMVGETEGTFTLSFTADVEHSTSSSVVTTTTVQEESVTTVEKHHVSEKQANMGETESVSTQSLTEATGHKIESSQDTTCQSICDGNITKVGNLIDIEDNDLKQTVKSTPVISGGSALDNLSGTEIRSESNIGSAEDSISEKLPEEKSSSEVSCIAVESNTRVSNSSSSNTEKSASVSNNDNKLTTSSRDSVSGVGEGEQQVLSSVEQEIQRPGVEQNSLYSQPGGSPVQKHHSMEEEYAKQNKDRGGTATTAVDNTDLIDPCSFNGKKDFDEAAQSHGVKASKSDGFNFGGIDSGLDEHDFEPRGKRGAGGVQVSYEDDGSHAFEKTTTYIAGDTESTDELIKRILAEARGEVYTPSHRSSHEQRSESSSTFEESAIEHGTLSRNSEDAFASRSVLDRKYGSYDQPSLEPVRRSKYMQEEYEEESMIQRRGHYADRQKAFYNDDDDSQVSGAIGGADGGLRSRQFRSNLMQKQQAILQHDDLSDDEEVFRRQPEVEYIPDEEFIPQKAEDTDRVVAEKSEAIRDVVDKQSSVLQQLKSASDSFEEISAEIRELKQNMLDSQMRRSMILDEIEHERMMMDQQEYESNPRQAYQRPSQRGRYVREDYAEEEYIPVRPTNQRQVALDRELEADTLGKGGLTSLAYGSSSMASPLDTFRSKLSEKYHTALTGSAAYSSNNGSNGNNYGLEKSSKYESLYDEASGYMSKYGSESKAGKYKSSYDIGDEPAPSRGRSRHTLTRSYGALDDNDEPDETSYRSPNLPNYRKYDYDKKDTASVSSSEYSDSRYSASTSRRYASLPRSKTLDYSSSYGATRSVRQTAPVDSGFSSRFLNKVREKKASGEQVSRGDKPFTSRFLGKSFDTGSSFPRPPGSKSEDAPKCNGNSEAASTGE